MSNRFIEVLDFMHFYKHAVFIRNEKNVLEKHVRYKINVSVGIELVTVDMRKEIYGINRFDIP